MGACLGKQLRGYRDLQQRAGEKLVTLADRILAEERKGFVLKLVENVLTIACIASKAKVGLVADMAMTAVQKLESSEEKKDYEKEVEEMRKILRELLQKSTNFTKSINGSVHKNHRINFSEEQDHMDVERYRKYNKHVQRSVAALNKTLEAVRLSTSLSTGNTQQDTQQTNKLVVGEKTSQWKYLQPAANILEDVVRYFGGSQSDKLREIGNCLMQEI